MPPAACQVEPEVSSLFSSSSDVGPADLGEVIQHAGADHATPDDDGTCGGLHGDSDPSSQNWFTDTGGRSARPKGAPLAASHSPRCCAVLAGVSSSIPAGSATSTTDTCAMIVAAACPRGNASGSRSKRQPRLRSWRACAPPQQQCGEGAGQIHDRALTRAGARPALGGRSRRGARRQQQPAPRARAQDQLLCGCTAAAVSGQLQPRDPAACIGAGHDIGTELHDIRRAHGEGDGAGRCLLRRGHAGSPHRPCGG